MLTLAVRAISWILGLFALVVIVFLGVRVYISQQGPQLEPWHLYAPVELSVDEIDGADWEKYLRAEGDIFDSVRANVGAKLAVEDLVPFNRYFEGSAVNPDHFDRNWNRSYRLEPKGRPVGAVCTAARFDGFSV